MFVCVCVVCVCMYVCVCVWCVCMCGVCVWCVCGLSVLCVCVCSECLFGCGVFMCFVNVLCGVSV